MDAIDEINALARSLHGNDKEASAYTLRSLAEHVEEVRQLLDAADAHWRAETADIIIHGMMLLRRGGVDKNAYDVLMSRRMARFREKIAAADHKNNNRE